MKARFRQETPEERHRRISQRHVDIQSAGEAQTVFTLLGPTFRDIQNILLDQLIDNTKKLGEIDDHSVYELVALRDVEVRLRERIQAGMRAEKALEKDKPEAVNE